MASTLTIDEVVKWFAAIKLIDTDEAVIGGADGVSNQQAIQLAARTLWLRAQIEAVLDAAGLTLDTSVTTQLRDAIAALIAAAIDGIDLPGAATETAAGLVELATIAEAKAGKDGERAVTPAGLAAALPDVSGYLLTTTFTAFLAKAIAFYDTAQTWSGVQSCAVVTLTDAASIAWDLSAGQAFTVSLSASRTLAAPTNIRPGTVYHLRVVVEVAGSVLSYASAYKGVSGITLATTAGAVNRLTFVGSDDGASLELAAYRAGVAA